MVHKVYKRMLDGMKKKQKKSRAKKNEEWSVYILRCGDESLYTGAAKDIDKRFLKHSSGKGARYTRTRLPLEIVYRESCRSRTDALVRECAVKALNRPKKLALISGEAVSKEPARKKAANKKKGSGARRKVLAAFLLLVMPSAAFAKIEYPWQSRKKQDGIQVEVRKVPDSLFLEFRSVMTVDAAIDKVLALYEDASKVPEWYYECVESAEIKRLNAAESIHYFAMDMPWPVKNRDSVYKRTKSVDPATGVVEYRLEEAPGYAKPRRGKVRVPRVKGLWRFTPKGARKTEIFYQQHGEAGGNIPAFIVNRLAVDVPFSTLSEMRAALTGEAGKT